MFEQVANVFQAVDTSDGYVCFEISILFGEIESTFRVYLFQLLEPNILKYSAVVFCNVNFFFRTDCLGIVIRESYKVAFSEKGKDMLKSTKGKLRKSLEAMHSEFDLSDVLKRVRVDLKADAASNGVDLKVDATSNGDWGMRDIEVDLKGDFK